MSTRVERFASPQSLPAPRRWLLLFLVILLIVSDLMGPNGFVEPEILSLDIQIVLALSAIALGLWDRVEEAQRAQVRNRLIALVTAFAFAGASAEAATRWVFRNVTASSDGGGFFARKWASTNVLINEHGFRERSYAAEKPPGVYRIAVIGDSFTFGNGIEPRERYSDRLNEWLPDNVEVLNFGQPGANTIHHLHTLTSKVLPAKPDYVLLQWFVNDVEGNELTGRPSVWRLIPVKALHDWLNAHSALYTVANMRWAEVQIAMGLAPSYADYLKNRAADDNSADAQREVQTLRTIIETTRRHGSGVGIVLFPDPGPDMGPSYPYAFLHDRVLGVCRETQTTCVDLRSDFASVKDRRSLWVSPFDHHPSARANEMAAVDILKIFQAEWSK